MFRTSISTAFPSIGISPVSARPSQPDDPREVLDSLGGETVGAHRFGHPSHSGTITIKWKYANVTTATGTRRLRRSPFAWIRPATDCFLRNRRKGRASRFISPKTLSISIALRTTVTSTRGKMKLQVGFQVENHL